MRIAFGAATEEDWGAMAHGGKYVVGDFGRQLEKHYSKSFVG